MDLANTRAYGSRDELVEAIVDQTALDRGAATAVLDRMWPAIAHEDVESVRDRIALDLGVDRSMVGEAILMAWASTLHRANDRAKRKAFEESTHATILVHT